MSSTNNGNRQFALNQLIWIGISIGVSFAISRLLPFPISLVAIVGVFLVLGYFMRSNTMRKIGMRSRDRSGIFGSVNPASTWRQDIEILLFELRDSTQSGRMSKVRI